MRIKGLDGNIRDAEAEYMLREAVQIVFNSPAGEYLLRELERMTIRLIGGPKISSDELRHLEGQRFIVGLLRNYLHAPSRGESHVRSVGHPAESAQ